MRKQVWLSLAALAAVLILFPACQAGTETVRITNTATVTLTSTVTATATATDTDPATRTITDMYGRQVTVPATINRVLTSGSVEMQLVFMLAPEKLAGLSNNFNGSPPLVSEQYAALPVVGSWSGGSIPNIEAFLAIEPDIIIDGFGEDLEDHQQKFGSVPVVGVDSGDLLLDYAPIISFLGDLLGVPDKAEELLAYYTEAMDYVNTITANIPADERIMVYYAEGTNGLSTDPAGSFHTDLITFCGGNVVADVQLLPGVGQVTVSMEQILLWDPDLIIIGRGSQANLYLTIMTDSIWGMVQAVNDGLVFVRPDNPLSWFDGPPGLCQIVGMYWMAHTLYPDKTVDLDLNAKIKEFYTKFLHYDLSDAELTSLLANPEL
ncbi:MAG: ABC transporter substrate-binding protein [Dehalococcoidia bacterium]|nr:ABC transporter substrate-binding protein [Dehalococcoidia bacterium]